MAERRTVKISIMLAPRVAAQLDAYAEKHRWSRSNAAAILVEAGLLEQEQQNELDDHLAEL